VQEKGGGIKRDCGGPNGDTSARLVVLHSNWRYVTQPRDFAGFPGAPALSADIAKFH